MCNVDVVGLSCEDFEDQMMALFSVIEASRYQNSSESVPALVIGQRTEETASFC
jgi:hypothetical protein